MDRLASRYAYGLVICAAALVFSFEATAKESVRGELIRLQRESGLTFAWIHEGVQAVSFETRDVVNLKDSLQAFRPDEFSYSNYPNVSGIGMCWSHDQTKLASTMIERRTGAVSLGVLDLGSKRTSPVAFNDYQRPYVSSQCWSSDDKHVAFDIEGRVKIYDVGSEPPSVRDLADGTDVSWSPDGSWISFLDRDTYYAIHADGSGRKKLFHKRGAASALYWSPDSRIVAYVSQQGLLEGGFSLDVESYRLRVRRLADNSEAWVAGGADGYANYHWIKTDELMEHASSRELH